MRRKSASGSFAGMGNLLGCRIGAMGGGSIANAAAMETSIFTRSCLGGRATSPARRAVFVMGATCENVTQPLMSILKAGMGDMLFEICLSYEHRSTIDR